MPNYLDDTGHFTPVSGGAVTWSSISGKPTEFPPVAATTSVLGGVKVGAAVPDLAAQTVTGADAAAVATSATTAVNACQAKINALLAQLRIAGVITP